MVFAQPTLTHVFPAAVAPGATTELTLHGTKLDGRLKVWTSFPARVQAARRLVIECSGACGDLGTFIPHVIGAMTVAGLAPAGVLLALLPS